MSKVDGMPEAILRQHLKNCFASVSGEVALDWLRRQCWMDITCGTAIKDALFDVNARRDLFINLESHLKETEHYVASE